MTRSIWKGPFVDGYMIERLTSARRVGPLRHHASSNEAILTTEQQFH